jgi:rhodanese-related sulfurtransferase
MPDSNPISPEKAKAMWESGAPVVFVDARNAQAWGESDVKLPGAVRVPADKVEEDYSKVPKNAAAIAYCT